MKRLLFICTLMSLFFCSSCIERTIVVEQQLNEEASIYPDYKEVTIPANIAPLNISLKNLNDAQLILEGESGESFQIASEKGFFDIPQAKWSELLNKNKGKKIKLTVCKQVEGKWSALTPFYIFVAQEPIDKYIAYRLIPPDYELWNKMGIYQRNLETFEESTIYEAAEKLFIAQPTLTGAVRDVENELGIQIFHRTHKGVIPTAEGDEFLQKIKRVYQQYEDVMEEYGEETNIRRRFAVSMQHYSFAVKAFIEMAKHYDSNKFDLALRETATANVIKDVSTMKSEIGIIYTCETNQRMINKLLRKNELEFHSLIVCSASVYIARSHPLAKEKELGFEQLDPYPCLSFEQGNEDEIYFAEEILIEHAYQKTVKATDRATMMNLMEGLNGYTLCSSIYSEKLCGDQFIVIPFKDDDNIQSSMNIGYIIKKNNELSSMGKRFLDEVRKELELRE